MGWKIISRKEPKLQDKLFASVIYNNTGLYLSRKLRDKFANGTKSIDVYRNGYNLGLVPRQDDEGRKVGKAGTVSVGSNTALPKGYKMYIASSGTINNHKGFILKPRKEL